MKSRRFFCLFTCLAVATLCWNHSLAQEAGSTLLLDNFTKDSGLNTGLWTTNSSFLNSLGMASSSPPGTFEEPQLTFSRSLSGMHMTGITQDYELTGIQSLSTFSPPFTAVVYVTPIKGTANPFYIYLASPDLAQFLTLAANVSSSYDGFWVDATGLDIGLPYLGEEFSPPIAPKLKTPYKIVLSVDADGTGTANVEDVYGSLLGSLSDLGVGTDSFYLVLGQRIGAASPGQQLADWSYVRVSSQ